MTEQQFRLETQNGVEDILNRFMLQNQIPASYMEDAINKYLVSLQKQVLREFLIAAYQDQPVKEEDNGGSE